MHVVLQTKLMSSLAYPVEKGVPMCIFRKKSACPCWSTLLKRASLCAFCFDVSVGRLQGAATANFLAGVSVGRLQGAAIANFLAAFLWVAYKAVFAIS